ncbi:MAG: SUI1 family translation initiation factor [Planctomycetota bacterium]|jgi:translation initiation factor 1 (eIF-1/SUI1)
MGEDNPFQKLFAEAGLEGTGKFDSDGRELDPETGEPFKEVVLGYERRGGEKVVTTVRDIPEARTEEILGFIKKAFGTGGTVDDSGLLVIQGDRRAQLTRWFEKQDIRVRGERD